MNFFLNNQRLGSNSIAKCKKEYFNSYYNPTHLFFEKLDLYYVNIVFELD